MTTEVLIVNFGPDPVLVRVVEYGPADLATPKPAMVIDDRLLHPTESQNFYVHTSQQLLIGEKRATEEVRDAQ